MRLLLTLLLSAALGVTSGCASSTKPREVTVQVERVPPDSMCLETCQALPLLKSGNPDEAKRLMVEWGTLYRTCADRQACLAKFYTP